MRWSNWRNVRRLFSDCHEDGTRHEWRSKRGEFVGQHWCEWDYCSCFWLRCKVCGDRKLYSSGSQEIR